ncbi:hypothetical protein EPN29_09045 [bacterium]|nr:MAG: hypothetical protein EPN29_09045 [bacterium]
MALATGLLLCLVGVVLLLNVGGAANFVIHRVTSRPLGELAPGFAASSGGFRVYATLVLAIGVCVSGVGIADRSAVLGAATLAIGLVSFAVASVIAIMGEITTYRALKR